MPNGSRVIKPGCVMTSIEPVMLLTRTATCPASTDAHEWNPISTITSAPAASHKRDGSPPAPRSMLRRRDGTLLLISVMARRVSPRAHDDGEQVLGGPPRTQRGLDEDRREPPTRGGGAPPPALPSRIV